MLSKTRQRLPHNIDGDCVFELPYDKDTLMASSSDGRPWKHWCTSKRQGFRGIRICKNTPCPNLHSCGKENKVQFKKMAENEVVCSRCGYEAQGISCEARKIWKFEDGKVIVFHCGEHKCSVKEQSPLTFGRRLQRFAVKILRQNHPSFLINICEEC